MTWPKAELTEKIAASTYLVNNHDEVYPIWKNHSLTAQTLIHLDGHMDFEWITDQFHSNPDHKHIHLGNYLYPAAREGIFNRWYWVVPDPMWNSSIIRKRLWKELLLLFQARPNEMTSPQQNKNSFSANILGIPFWMGPYSLLPAISEPALLNLDVDYLCHGTQAWIWPDKLWNILSEKIRPALTTISYSVRGGYTPIQYKFFGQALSDFANKKNPPAYFELKDFMIHQREFDSFQGNDDYAVAKTYLKARHLANTGATEDAAELFKTCGERDDDFKSNQNHLAWFYFSQGKFKESLGEYQLLKNLGDHSPHRLLGEARCYFALNQNGPSEARCRQVLEKYPGNESAWFLIAKIQACKKKFTLALTSVLECLRLNPDSLMPKILMGECHYRLNHLEDAKNILRQSLGEGGHFPITYFLLAKTYWKLGLLKKALDLFTEWLRLVWRQRVGS